MPVHEKDYDEAADSQPIRVRVRGEWYEYPAEAPIDVAIQWMDRQTRTANQLDESGSEYMLGNYRTVLGAKQFEEMRANGAGSKQVDEIYRDLLDWWGLWLRPKAEPSEIDDMLDRLEVLIKLHVDDETAAISMASLTSEIRAAAERLEPREAADEVPEEETAGNPA